MRRWEKQAFTSLAIPYRNIHSLTVAGRRAFFFFLEQFCFLMIQKLAAANDPIHWESRVPNQNGEFGSADFGCRASVCDVRCKKNTALIDHPANRV